MLPARPAVRVGKGELLSDQNKLPAPGWYNDQHGRKRWWNGSKWGQLAVDSQTAPQLTPQAATGPEGTRVCPHCGQSGPASGKKCPSCGKRYGKRTMLKVGAAIAGLVVLCVVGFGVLVAVLIDEDKENFEKTAITWAEFRAIPIGMSEQKVRSALEVEPEIEEEEEWESVHGGQPVDRLCIYYNKSDDYPNMFRFCFDDETLKSKDNWQ